MTIHKNMFPEAVALQLNDHKTLPCTNVSAHSYYLRKLRTNLFGIYCANEETIHCFFYDLLNKMKTKHGRFDQLTILCDNSQGQFKEYFSFFFNLDYLVKKVQYLRRVLNFLSKGHSYLMSDRQFCCIQKFFDTVERVQLPQEWAVLLKNSPSKKYQGTLGNFKHDQGL